MRHDSALPKQGWGCSPCLRQGRICGERSIPVVWCHTGSRRVRRRDNRGGAAPPRPYAGARTPAPAKAQGALPRARPTVSPFKRRREGVRAIKGIEDEWKAEVRLGDGISKRGAVVGSRINQRGRLTTLRPKSCRKTMRIVR